MVPASEHVQRCTPGCTDYSPNAGAVLKSQPGFAESREARFRHFTKVLSYEFARPHSYERMHDESSKKFGQRKDGSFSNAKRFKYQGQGAKN
jgi:hypothetical protein